MHPCTLYCALHVLRVPFFLAVRRAAPCSKGKSTVLITTNLLSRGVDVPAVSLVVNFDVPEYRGVPEYDTYAHRCVHVVRHNMTPTGMTGCLARWCLRSRRWQQGRHTLVLG